MTTSISVFAPSTALTIVDAFIDRAIDESCEDDRSTRLYPVAFEANLAHAMTNHTPVVKSFDDRVFAEPDETLTALSEDVWRA